MSQATATLELTATASTPSSRLSNIDFLRGIVLILMVLDHSRHFFSNIEEPLDLSVTTPFLFFTRWITHFCAPTFILLAGVSAAMYAAKSSRTIKETSWFLFTRGMWFIFAEFTIILFIWTFYLTPFQFDLEIFWTIGTSMVLLSFLIFLPRWLILMISLILIAGHNSLDTISAASLGQFSSWWLVLHQTGKFYLFNIIPVNVGYPMIPWVGVMALGYVIGPLFLAPVKKHRLIFVTMGIFFIIAFLFLRYLNIYGDMEHWSAQKNSIFTLMSFLNCTKYPPSLLYLLMTLGPVFIILGLLTEKFCALSFNKMIIQFGRVPFIFYILHLIFILGLALLVVDIKHGSLGIHAYVLNKTLFGYPLPIVYIVWISVLLALYYPCRWYGNIKARSRNKVFSYL